MVNRSIYPISGAERELPFYIEGIGFNDWQFDIIRKKGYPHNQIIYCTRGKGRLILDGHEYIITPNMCFFLPADYPHEYYTIGDLWETHWIAFGGYDALPVMDKLGFKGPQVLTLPSLDSLEEIFQKTYLTMKTDRIFGTFTASALLYGFLLEFHRVVYGKSEQPVESAAGGSKVKGSSLVQVLNYIDLHYHEDIELETLCEIAGITPQHLCRVFRKRLNMRPVEYIAKKRIQSAKNLLLTTDKSIGDISAEVGYRDISYFGALFRKCEGLSPSEYRKKCR